MSQRIRANPTRDRKVIQVLEAQGVVYQDIMDTILELLIEASTAADDLDKRRELRAIYEKVASLIKEADIYLNACFGNYQQYEEYLTERIQRRPKQ